MADDPKRAAAPPPTAPPQPETSVQKSEPAAKNVPVRNLEMKAILLLAFTLALILGSALFLMRVPCGLRGARVMIAEFDVSMREVDDCLHALPTRWDMAEQSPCSF